LAGSLGLRPRRVRCRRLLKVAREIRKPFIALGYAVHQSLAVGVAQIIMYGARLLSAKTPMVLVPDELRGWFLSCGRHAYTPITNAWNSRPSVRFRTTLDRS